MATYEITISTEDQKYPVVTGIRRVGWLRSICAAIKNKLARRPPNVEPGNKVIADFQTMDIVLDVKYDHVRDQIIRELADTTDLDKARLVFCLPVKRKKREKAVEV